jgi:hypothetical protein
LDPFHQNDNSRNYRCGRAANPYGSFPALSHPENFKPYFGVKVADATFGD